MKGMGYHYGPCQKGGGALGLFGLMAAAYILWHFAHAIIEALIFLGIGLGIGAVMIAVVMGYWAIEARKGEREFVANKARKASVTREDVRTIVLYREWLALPLEDRVAPEWDFFTGIDDTNRVKALETMRMQEAGNARRNRN